MKKLEVRQYLQASADVKGWFFPIDASLFGAVDEIQKMEGVEGNLFEIGVHHGKSTVLLARTLHGQERLGVCDIFEEQGLNRDASGKGDRDIFLGHMRSFGKIKDGELKVFAKSSEDLSVDDTTDRCRFFHIDGGHWPEIVLSDLITADKALLPEGVVALDDVFNPSWPGVGEGFYRFMREHPGRLVPLIIGANKVFLARPDFVATFRKYATPAKEFSKMLDAGPFSFEDKEWLGQKVLTAIRHSWVDLQPMRAALSHLGAARGTPLREFLRR
ncbi:MAG: class I SAM-dependent methyltransferase [Hyphomonadaceae bacterium]|nr:class I SAM-dependent methyltransferase [Hyphomonadaceae bacterium]